MTEHQLGRTIRIKHCLELQMIGSLESHDSATVHKSIHIVAVVLYINIIKEKYQMEELEK